MNTIKTILYGNKTKDKCLTKPPNFERVIFFIIFFSQLIQFFFFYKRPSSTTSILLYTNHNLKYQLL